MVTSLTVTVELTTRPLGRVWLTTVVGTVSAGTEIVTVWLKPSTMIVRTSENDPEIVPGTVTVMVSVWLSTVTVSVTVRESGMVRVSVMVAPLLSVTVTSVVCEATVVLVTWRVRPSLRVMVSTVTTVTGTVSEIVAL